MTTNGQVIIQGITVDDKKFRPSDWAERLCGAVATYGNDRRTIFHPYVSLASIDGIKCIVIDKALKKEDEMLFNFLMDFAKDNSLQVTKNKT
jgi:hypothetical protein